MSKRARLKTRGATFTIMVLVTATILLVIGSAFVDSLHNLVKLQGDRDRQEQAKEALVGSAEWARASLASGTSVWPRDRKELATTLKLSRAAVALTLKADGETVRAEAVASVKPGAKSAASFTLARRGDAWVVTQLVLKPAP